MPMKSGGKVARPVQGTTTVERERSERDGSKTVLHAEQKTEQVGQVVEGPAPLCNVGFRLDRSCNLGNYESLKVGISINVPCEQADVEEAFEASVTWVEAKLSEVLERYGVGGADQSA